MKNSYQISFQLYRAVLVLIFILFFISKFLVGVGGHNSNIEKSEILLLIFLLFSFFIFFVLRKSDASKRQFKNLIRFISIALVLMGCVFSLLQLKEIWQLMQEQNFTIYGVIPLVIILLFNVLSGFFIAGLVKNKI